jgi:hypothetical protein
VITFHDAHYFSQNETKVLRISIEDKLFEQFSTNVRFLARELQDWVDLSSEWDFAIGKLRTADWLLRNDPTPLSPGHPTLEVLEEGLSKLRGLYKNMSSEIQKTCSHIVASGEKILENRVSNLNIALQSLLDVKDIDSSDNFLVVRQESIKLAVERWLKGSQFSSWHACTAQEIIHSASKLSNIVIVGLTQDYPVNLFNSSYPENPIMLLSNSWIREQKTIKGYFSDIAQINIEIEIETINKLGPDSDSQEVAVDFLEPSAEIDGRRLVVAARRALSDIEKATDEDMVTCRAYLLGSGEVVFLPTATGSIDAIDFHAPNGEKVQRVPIQNLTTDSILLLRVGSSEGEAIVNMANELGGDEAQRCRVLQKNWKSNLKEKLTKLGSQKVTRDLQDLGITNPWIAEWASAGTIRPNSLDNFTTLLAYLDIEPLGTIEAMNSLRHLHQVAGMRFRSILKKKFETLDLEPIMLNGFTIVKLGDEAGVAKLGAYRCVSIGKDVFDVPESAVKQLQPGIGA